MKRSNKISRKENNSKSNLSFRFLCFVVLVIASTTFSFAQNLEQPAVNDTSNVQARVIGLDNICVHVLQLEKSLKLYREILGFKLDDAVVFQGKGIEGMLAMKLKANDLTITLSLTAPEYINTIGPVGNTNHNHFMLRVNDIETIGNKLKEEGYELENENYARDKYTFFVGPNGEIIGLSAW
ncbi:VOC family protein [uncultured Lutibacter sp.]|uniref:VOC family protein n=1 Tax=uncultured Lutibacter sp. TaxID=437739 RepID=UPI002605B4B1|nr:VOC family protein [uncultured Lutibacter sp.]